MKQRNYLASLLFCAMVLCQTSSFASAPTVEEKDAIVEQKFIPVTATKSTNVPDGTIVIPESVVLGQVDTEGDTTIGYAITLNMDNFEYIDVDCNEDGHLNFNDDTLFYTNNFPRGRYTESKVIQATVTISEEDVNAATPGTYTGVMNFAFTMKPK